MKDWIRERMEFSEKFQQQGRVSQMNEKLIDMVIGQIKTDIESGDLTAIAELLKFVPEKYLVGYLPEELVK